MSWFDAKLAALRNEGYFYSGMTRFDSFHKQQIAQGTYRDPNKHLEDAYGGLDFPINMPHSHFETYEPYHQYGRAGGFHVIDDRFVMLDLAPLMNKTLPPVVGKIGRMIEGTYDDHNCYESKRMKAVHQNSRFVDPGNFLDTLIWNGDEDLDAFY
jgi:hypothetical protein